MGVSYELTCPAGHKHSALALGRNLPDGFARKVVDIHPVCEYTKDYLGTLIRESKGKLIILGKEQDTCSFCTGNHTVEVCKENIKKAKI